MSAYWIGLYREVLDETKVAAYAKLARPAIIKAGGTFLAAALPTECYESAVAERSVVIRFDTLEAAQNAYRSADYQAALTELGTGAVRDVRIVEGLD